MGIKLLIVDDNEGDRKLLEEILPEQEEDYEIYTAVSGEEGVEKAKKINPDIALIDTQMPGINGYETCKAIKELARNILVIITTGTFEAVDGNAAKEAGADDYCVKTSDCSSIISCLKKASASLR
ncbi:MAG: response regulator [Candidatus Omnitrophica bacterium]|nr:response regulator [Candidatus Omnitrophota bacterium]